MRVEHYLFVPQGAGFTLTISKLLLNFLIGRIFYGIISYEVIALPFMKHRFVRRIYLFHNILYELKKSCLFHLNEIRISFSDLLCRVSSRHIVKMKWC